MVVAVDDFTEGVWPRVVSLCVATRIARLLFVDFYREICGATASKRRSFTIGMSICSSRSSR